MAVQFERIAKTGNVLLKSGSEILHVMPPSAYVRKDGRDENLIIISNQPSPAQEVSRVEVKQENVTIPESADTDDLLRILATDYFTGQPPFDSNSFDAGGRLRVSELTTLIDLKHLADKLPLFFDEEIGGGASSVYNPAEAAVDMSVTNDGDYVIRQSKVRFNYQTGKSFKIDLTFDGFDIVAQVARRAGYYNSSIVSPFIANFDGIYLENDGTDVFVVVSKNGVDTIKVKQSDWAFDKLDGTGPSGKTVDWTKSQLLSIDFLWLGVDEVRFSLKIDGRSINFHSLFFSNLGNGVFMQSPNHSIRYEIRSTGGAGTLRHICNSINVEGTRNDFGKILSFDVGATHLNANSTGARYAALVFQLKVAQIDAFVDVLVFSMLSTTNGSFLWELRLNPTIAGAPVPVGQPDSAIEIVAGTTANTVTADGTLIDSGYVAGRVSERNSIENAIRLGATIAGVRDQMVLIVMPLSNNQDIYSSFTRRENI